MPATNHHNDDGRKRWFEGLGELLELGVEVLGEGIGFIFSALLELLSGL